MSKRLHNLGKFLQYLFHMQKLIEVCQSGAQSDTIISDTLAKNKSNHTSWEWYFFNKYYFLCGGIQMHFNSFVLMQRPALEYFLGTNKIGLKKKTTPGLSNCGNHKIFLILLFTLLFQDINLIINNTLNHKLWSSSAAAFLFCFFSLMPWWRHVSSDLSSNECNHLLLVKYHIDLKCVQKCVTLRLPICVESA